MRTQDRSLRRNVMTGLMEKSLFSAIPEEVFKEIVLNFRTTDGIL